MSVASPFVSGIHPKAPILGFMTALVLWFSPGLQARNTPFGSMVLVDGTLDGARTAVASDFDHDGDLDLASAAFVGDAVYWWENENSQGTVWTKRLIATSLNGPLSLSVCDLDGDGDLEILGVELNYDNVTFWRDTDGAGMSWSGHVVDGSFDGAQQSSAVDLDRDGDLDVIGAAAYANRIEWWENTDGQAYLWNSHPVDIAFLGARSVQAEDIDRDGDFDLVGAADIADLVSWWENEDGSGMTWTEHVIAPALDGANLARVADIDRDGDWDVVAGARFANQVWWYENTTSDGSSWTAHEIDLAVGAPFSLEVADLDEDGDVDILGASYLDDQAVWWENATGTGTIWVRRMIQSPFDGASDLRPADLDGDGDLDLIGTCQTGDDLAWWHNETIHRSALFPEIREMASSLPSVQLLGQSDLDRDGDMDVLLSSPDAGLGWLENGDGAGGSWTMHSVAAGFSDISSAVAADLDRDGDIDLAAHSASLGFLTWENTDGSASIWNQWPLAAGALQNARLQCQDIDQDGIVDLLVSTVDSAGAPLLWIRNDGTPWNSGWTTHEIGGTPGGCWTARIEDLNKDGFDDLVACEEGGGQVGWWRNDGSPIDGGWTFEPTGTSLSGAASVSAADIDKDGDLDLCAASSTDGAIVWCENLDGLAGSWAAHTVLTGSSVSGSMELMDLDRDGDLDIAAADAGAVASWLENDGTPSDGGWIHHPGPDSGEGGGSILMGDVNRDGRTDLVAACPDTGRVVWLPDSGGQAGFETTVPSLTYLEGGQTHQLLDVRAIHRGRTGDTDAEITQLTFLFKDDQGLVLSDSTANALFDSLGLYRDDGNGLFDAGSDSLVVQYNSIGLLSGMLRISLADDDPLALVEWGTEARFFLVAQMASDLSSCPVDGVEVTHLPGMGAKAENAVRDLPLLIEYAPDVSTGPIPLREYVPPTVSSIDLLDHSPTNSGLVGFRVTFSEPVQNADPDDFTVSESGSLTGSAVSSVLPAEGSNEVYDVTLTTGTGEGLLRLVIESGASILDRSDNSLTGLPVESPAYDVDKVPPVATITSLETSPTSAFPIPIQIGLSEPVQSLSVSDFNIAGGTAAGLAVIGETSYELTIIPSANPSLVEVQLPAGALADAAGNLSASSAFFSIEFSTENPTAYLTCDADSATSVSPVLVHVSFSETVSGFDPLTDGGQIALHNAVLQSVQAVDGATYELWILPEADGIVDVRITEGAGLGLLGKPSLESNALSFTFDTVPPVVGVLPLITNESRPILNGSVSESGCSVRVFVPGGELVTEVSGQNWSAQPIGAIEDGIYDVLAVAADAAGNSSTDATVDELLIDTVPPRQLPGAELHFVSGKTDPADVDLYFALTFDEPVSTVLTAGTIPGLRPEAVRLDQSTAGVLGLSIGLYETGGQGGDAYSIHVIGTCPEPGELTLSFVKGMIVDQAGNEFESAGVEATVMLGTGPAGMGDWVIY